MTSAKHNPPGARPMAAWSEALDLRAIVSEYGSPLYLHHPQTLQDAFEDYSAIVGASGVRYPVKANPSPLVLEAIARMGGGADCASRAEVHAALAAGIPLQRINYNTPAPNVEYALWLLRHGATVVADSIDGLRALELGMAREPLRGQIFVRINPGKLPGYLAAGEHQRYTAHGDPRSQFGIPSEDLVALLQSTQLPVRGLHVHVGTMMDNLAAFVDGLTFLHALADSVRAQTAHDPRTINLGGGLGLPHDRSQEHPTIATLGEALRSHLRPDCCYEVEPGNSLVGDSFALLTRIVSLKQARGRIWGICDVGTDQLVKHTVAGWRHEIVDAMHRALPGSGPDALAGPLCFAGDILLPETRLTGARTGDPLLIRHTGAYCEAIASRFNGRLGPATLVVEDGHVSRMARCSEDPFYAAEATAPRPIPSAPSAAASMVIPSAQVAALQSAYMHRQAEEDRYEIVSTRRCAEGQYEFTVEVDAPCGFIGMPLAIRMLGDAAIIAIGLELGWNAKRGAVLASRLTLSVEENLPGKGRFPIRVRVSAMSPSCRSDASLAGMVRFEMGELGASRKPALHGTAQVCAPNS